MFCSVGVNRVLIDLKVVSPLLRIQPRPSFSAASVYASFESAQFPEYHTNRLKPFVIFVTQNNSINFRRNIKVLTEAFETYAASNQATSKQILRVSSTLPKDDD